MKWLVFTGEIVTPPAHDPDRPGLDGTLWVMRPEYNSDQRSKKPEFQVLDEVPRLPTGKTSHEITLKGFDLTITIDDTTVLGTSIYSQTKDEYIEMVRLQLLALPDIKAPIHETTPWWLVDADKVPSDHVCGMKCQLRNAWEDQSVDGVHQVVVNMVKARVLRDEVFKSIKVREVLRAQALDDTDEVTRLKAITFDTSAYADPASLEMAWPDGLPSK